MKHDAQREIRKFGTIGTGAWEGGGGGGVDDRPPPQEFENMNVPNFR